MDQAVRYKIAEAARMAGVSPSTLRLWEGQGLIAPVRTPTGQRLFDQAEIEKLKKISYLRSEQGLNPAAIRQALNAATHAAMSASATTTTLASPGMGAAGGQPGLSGGSEGASGAGKSPPGETRPATDVGRKLRHLRRSAGKTLDQVARDLDIAVSALSTLERTSQGVSLKALHEIARYYGTTVSALAGERRRSTRESLVRAGDWTAWPQTTTGVTVQTLARGRHQMDCHRFVLAPGASSEGAYEHEGEEFLHVLSGRMEIVLDFDRFFVLSAGDSFYFESRRHHSWKNVHDGETVLIWINTPPTF